MTLSFKCWSITLLIPSSLTIEAVIANGVSAVTDLPVARNTATLTGLSFGTADFTASIFLLYASITCAALSSVWKIFPNNVSNGILSLMPS